MYKKIPATPNYPELEKDILDFWLKNDIKQEVLKLNSESDKIFSFYEGPPTANGEPHAGHVLTRALKDVYTRFAGMNGYFVPRKGGWDTHGLPVEIAVEKSLNISGKQEIEEFGVENFVEECKKNVWLCIDRWKEFSNAVGYSLNLDDDCYNPYDNKYIESVWWSLNEFDKKGLLYKGHKVLPSCPSCQTALSSHEVAQGYKDKTDTTLTVKAYCEELSASFLVWTTTPWTLLSNVAICVNPEETYVMVKDANGDKYILVEALVYKNFKDGEVEIIASYSGKELEGYKYAPFFDYMQGYKGKYHEVIGDGYVTTEDGTGIVHIAPAFGEDDNRVAHNWGMGFLQMVTATGCFTDDAGEFAGRYIFDANIDVIKNLAQRGLAFKKQKVTHSYPHCWRCSTPLIYYARDSWFVSTTKFKDKLIEENEKINWFPKSFKQGRMGNFLKNNVDWCLSRDRYWGTPLNVWECDCKNYKSVGSIAELVELSGCSEEIELHKPYIDAVEIKCSECGKMMKRASEVIDVWYDSGAMPFAQHHYPFENKEIFEERYPADFIFEGYDQTRGWFYSLEAINIGMFGKAPMKNCLANGMICDDKGFKMSKSKGNYADPMEFIRKYGGDTVRFMFYTNSQPYNDVIFSEGLLIDVQRKFMNTLYSCYSFFVLYANIDRYTGAGKDIKSLELTTMDRFILAKLNKLIASVKKQVSEYMATEAAREIAEFVDTLSNWYIRRSRKRFWAEGVTADKEAALGTLYTVLSALSKICAPFTPFISEDIYQNLERAFDENLPQSVHLCAYPVADSDFYNDYIETNMQDTYAFCELGRSTRTLNNLKIRQPLQRMYIKDNTKSEPLAEEFKDIIRDELNIKEIIENNDIDQFLSYNIKPQLRTLGPKHGKLIGDIKAYLENCNKQELVACINAGETHKATIKDTEVEFTRDDLLITTSETQGYAGSSVDHLTIVLDTTITPTLIEEYYRREFVSKVQGLRRKSDFDIVQKIYIEIDGDSEITDVLLKNQEQLKDDIFMHSIKQTPELNKGEAIDIEGREIQVYLYV